MVKKTKFVHFDGKKKQNSYTLVVADAPPSPAAVHSCGQQRNGSFRMLHAKLQDAGIHTWLNQSR